MEDIRFGLRTFAKHPGFTAIAVIALALGIGANATVFGIANGVLFKSLPFVSDRILYLSLHNVSQGENRSGVSYPDFRDWRTQTRTFQGLGAFNFNNSNVSDKDGVPSRYNVSQVTANTFTLIGQKPIVGRGFTDADEKPGAVAVGVLGYGMWENRYNKNPDVIGKAIKVDGVVTMIVGVMRRDLRFPIDSDMWTAMVPNADREKRSNRNLSVFGLLADNATEQTAAAEMETITHNLAQAYPDTDKGYTPVVHSFSEEFNGDSDTRTLIAALMGAVIFVLLIACANVANMLLARAVDRTREISIRIAIGAGRWRIIRQLLVESVMLSIVAGLFGWWIAVWGLRVFDASVRDRVPSWMTFSLDYRGFVYLGIVSIATGFIFGLVPALRLSKLDVISSLKDGGHGSSGGRRGKHLSGLLVVFEMAMAVVLLAGAGLMIRSFLNIYQAKTGVNEKNVLVMRLFLPDARYVHNEDQIAFHDRLKARLEALPGVEAATIATTMPTGGSMRLPYELEHADPVDAKRRPQLSVVVISPDYFRAMDVRLMRGRSFTDADGSGSPLVTIVNQRFADKFFPNEDPIGKRLRLFENDKAGEWISIVGVAPNILQNDISPKEFDPLIYLPFRQKPMRDVALMARTRVPPGTLGSVFRREVQAVDDDMPVYNLRTLEERLALNYWAQKIFASLFGIFAGIALVLASIGLYAVIAHSVSQRTQEIGLRMSLGASPTQILKMVFAQGMTQLLIGLLVGILAGMALTRAMTSLMVGVTSTDPTTFFLVSLVLAMAAALGCWIPARRAMRVDPLIALRQQ